VATRNAADMCGPARRSDADGVAANMRMRRPIYIFRWAILLLVTGACAGCGGVLDPAGPIGAAQKLILFNSVAIMLTIVVPTIVATLAFAWWFRASNRKAVYRPDFVFSGEIELLVWSIPILVILLLSGIVWIGSHQLDPAVPLASDRKTLEVQVVSLDWKWLFIYPEQDVAAVNELVIPTGTPVHFSLTSGSVMNVFFVPQLGSMIYTMNTMTTQLHLKSDRPGTFRGISAHFSGDGFPKMVFNVHSVSDDAFDGWVRNAKRTGPMLDDDAYRELSKPSIGAPPAVFGSVAPDLFRSIVLQELPPGPGPAPSVHPVSSESE
jgi:cytochrome o ubiquinol oxidase subunit II